MPVDLSMVGLQGQQAYADRIQTLAQADLQRSQAKENELKNEETQRINTVMENSAKYFQNKVVGLATPGSMVSESEDMTSPLDPLMQVAMDLGAAGLPHKATEMLDKVFEQKKRISDIEKDAVTRQNALYDQSVKRLDLVGRLFNSDAMQNQSEQDARIAEARQINANAGEELIPEYVLEMLEAQGYIPEVQNYITSSVLSMKEQIEQRRKDEQQEDTNTYRAQLVKNADARLALARDRQAEAERKQRHAEKVAGRKTVTAPTPQELADARTLLKNSVYKGKAFKTDQYGRSTDEAFEGMASSIVNRAKAIIASNPVTTWEYALSQAVAQGKADGSISVKQVPDPLHALTGGRVGGTEEVTGFEPTRKPVPLPSRKADLVIGTTYTVKNQAGGTSTVVWDGEKGVPVK